MPNSWHFRGPIILKLFLIEQVFDRATLLVFRFHAFLTHSLTFKPLLAFLFLSSATATREDGGLGHKPRVPSVRPAI